MRINNKDEALDLLFSQARAEKNPVSQAETVKLLQSKKIGGFKRFFNQKTIFMMTSVFVTFSLLLYFLNPAERGNLNTFNQKEKTENETIKHFPGNDDMAIDKGVEKTFARKNQHVSTFEKPTIPYLDTSKNVLNAKNDIKIISSFTDSNQKDVEPESRDIHFITSPQAKLIQLPEEVLTKLNIYFSKDGICIIENNMASCYNMKGSKHTVPKDYYVGKPKKQENGSYRLQINQKYMRKRDSIKEIQPILITDDAGKHWRRMHFSDENAQEMIKLYPELDKMPATKEEAEIQTNLRLQYINSKLNTLIPVLIKMPEEYRKRRAPRKNELSQDLILWFEYSEAFLKLISDTSRNRFISEYPKLSIITSTSETKPDLKITTSYSGIEKFSLYPNPVIDKANINFHLEKDIKVNITLHDVSGKLIKVFVRNETKSAGKNSMQIDLIDQIQGIYILSIETADGKILTQRIIKQ